jgi:SAM-dependent methyltransferase
MTDQEPSAGDDLGLLADLHRSGVRQGPGSTEETRRAIALSGLGAATGLRVADLGCGTGAPTLVLAEDLDAHVVGVDLFADFVHQLDLDARRRNLTSRISTVAASIAALPFPEHSFDAIWSEGAVYNLGFEAGIRSWRRHLKPGGVLAVSELIWLTEDRPAEIHEHWIGEYPEVDTAAAKVAVLEEQGYSLIGSFVLPETCWLDEYYRPLQARVASFLDRHRHSEAARRVVHAEQHEISLYERYSAHFGYGYFVARRNDGGA